MHFLQRVYCQGSQLVSIKIINEIKIILKTWKLLGFFQTKNANKTYTNKNIIVFLIRKLEREEKAIDVTTLILNF